MKDMILTNDVGVIGYEDNNYSILAMKPENSKTRFFIDTLNNYEKGAFVHLFGNQPYPIHGFAKAFFQVTGADVQLELGENYYKEKISKLTLDQKTYNVPVDLGVPFTMIGGGDIKNHRKNTKGWLKTKRNFGSGRLSHIISDITDKNPTKFIDFYNTKNFDYMPCINEIDRKSYENIKFLNENEECTSIDVNVPGVSFRQERTKAFKVFCREKQEIKIYRHKENHFKPGYGLNVGKTKHTEQSLLKKVIEDFGIEIPEIYFECAVDKTMTKPEMGFFKNGRAVIRKDDTTSDLFDIKRDVYVYGYFTNNYKVMFNEKTIESGPEIG